MEHKLIVEEIFQEMIKVIESQGLDFFEYHKLLALLLEILKEKLPQ